MEIKATARLNVEIDVEQQLEITKHYLYKVFKIPEHAFIDEKHNLVYWNEISAGQHSFEEKIIIRKANVNDLIFFNFMNTLDDIPDERDE